MKDKIRLVLINMAVTAIIISSLNFLSSAVLLVSGEIRMLLLKANTEKQDEKIEEQALPYIETYTLPNYDNDRELMKIHSQEFVQNFNSYSYEAYIGWSMKPFQGKTITIDNNGDRVHENVRGGEKSNKSVYFFGGSTMWGEGAPDNGTIPALFSSISGMPSYNKGERGFNSRQGIARLVNLLAEGEQIDIVIFYDGVNDVTANCSPELEVNEHYYTDDFRKRMTRKVFAGKEENWLTNEKVKLHLNGSEFLQYLDFSFLFGTRSLAAKIKRKIFGVQSVVENDEGESIKVKGSVDGAYVCDNSEELAQNAAESIVNNWEIAHDLAEARGIKFLAILQPVAYVGNPKLTHLNFDEWENERGLQYKTVYPLIKDVIRKRGHKWIVDYTDMFSRDEYIYIDFCHVSPNGNLIIAKQIYKDIKPYLE
ncbi:MAG: SGNH/GDSL hydrolase family protein [Hormoscilla sp.]